MYISALFFGMLMVMKKEQTQRGFTFVEGLLIVVLVGIVGFAGWYVYDSNKKTNSIYDKSASVDGVAEYEKKTASQTGQVNSDEPVISNELKENVTASVESKNTAALEGYMADNVTVVIAASEKGGSVPKVQAIKDLNYLSTGTMPWNFDLDEATLNAYKAGFYKQYFEGNTIVGKSANDLVVVFRVNSDGKIDSVFMAANAGLLTE